jgi:hypothetical protein
VKFLKVATIMVAQIILSVVAFGQTPTPTLVHSDSLASTGEPGNGFRIQYGGAMGSGSLAGNLLTLRITSPHGSAVTSIIDNLNDTYALGVSVDSGSGGWVTSMYYLAGAPAGITQITVTYLAPVADWHGSLQEYSGVATTSPVDGTCSNHSTTIACSAAITTTAPNDLIVATMIGLGGSIYENTMTGVTPGGNFILDAADTGCSDADEEYVQAAPGAVTPSFSVTGNAEAFNVVGIAFKAAAAGTNPTGMYILHQQHEQVNTTTNSQTEYFVSSGNLVVVGSDVGPDSTTIAINSCTPTNTWTEKTQGSLYPQFFYLPSGASFSTNLHCTVTTTQVGNHAIIAVYDVVNAASSPFNVLGAAFANNGNTVTGNISSTATPGIMFAAENTGQGPTTGVGSGFIFDNTPYTGESDGGQLNNGDGWQHYFFNSTAALTYTWNQANSGSYMQATAIAFLAGSPLPPVTVTVSPTSDSLVASSTLQFTATVTGPNTAVTWSASCGTVSSSGLYTAPPVGEACTVIATSQANPSDSASASLIIIPPIVAVAISPTSGSINASTTLPFSSTVTGSLDTAVNWSASCGSINASGLYTAPASTGTCTITATSQVNSADFASAIITVTAPVVTVSVNPRIAVNASLQIIATVAGTANTSVTWTTTCGTVSSSGLFRAPSTAGSCTVTATSQINTADSASVVVSFK